MASIPNSARSLFRRDYSNQGIQNETCDQVLAPAGKLKVSYL